MTVDDVRQRVAAIEAAVYDDEEAHALEDSLYKDVLLAIAAGKAPIECAGEALKAREIKFARWYA